MRHNDFKLSLYENKRYYNDTLKIREDKHQLFVSRESKNTLSSLNDKKNITQTADGFVCYSFGHKALEKNKKMI